MPGMYNFFKEPKCRCNICMDVIKSKNDLDWISCSCGQTSIKGISYIMFKGDNYTDLSTYNLENLPESQNT